MLYFSSGNKKTTTIWRRSGRFKERVGRNVVIIANSCLNYNQNVVTIAVFKRKYNIGCFYRPLVTTRGHNVPLAGISFALVLALPVLASASQKANICSRFRPFYGRMGADVGFF